MSYQGVELGGMEKTPQHTESKAGSFDDETGGHAALLKGHAQNDRADMSRMGKEQELRVCFVAYRSSHTHVEL